LETNANATFFILNREQKTAFTNQVRTPSCICAGILKQYMGTRNQVGIGMSYRPARLHIDWRNRFHGMDSWASNTVSLKYRLRFLTVITYLTT
jgi:hypothetical protein